MTTRLEDNRCCNRSRSGVELDKVRSFVETLGGFKPCPKLRQRCYYKSSVNELSVNARRFNPRNDKNVFGTFQ